MKRNQLLLLSLLALGMQGVSTGSALADLTPNGAIVETSYPMDGEGHFNLPAIESYAERQARVGESPDAWGVGRREVMPHDPFPFGGGPVGD